MHLTSRLLLPVSQRRGCLVAMTIERISLALARRIALAAQGFGAKRREAPKPAQLMGVLGKTQLYQIDSVNVLSRAHYLPAYSRLGAYDQADLDELVWGSRRKRKLFEYWAHEASMLPFDLYPLLRWRMTQADRGEAGWGRMRVYATEQRPEAMALLDRIRSEGPLAASDSRRTAANRDGGNGVIPSAV